MNLGRVIAAPFTRSTFSRAANLPVEKDMFRLLEKVVPRARASRGGFETLRRLLSARPQTQVQDVLDRETQLQQEDEHVYQPTSPSDVPASQSQIGNEL